MDLNIIHIWLMNRDEIIRGDKFWKMDSIKFLIVENLITIQKIRLDKQIRVYQR